MNIKNLLGQLRWTFLFTVIILSSLSYFQVITYTGDVQPSDLPAVQLTTLNTVLGVILGFVASTIMNIHIQSRREKSQSNNVRKAIFSELQAMNGFFDKLCYIDYSHPQAAQFADLLSTQAYESNLNQLGKLTPKEVRQIVYFYSELEEIRTMIRIAAGTDAEDTASGRVMGPDRRTASILNTIWLSCIDEIRQNIPESDRPPERDLNVINTDDDTPTFQDDIEEIIQGALADFDEEETTQEGEETDAEEDSEQIGEVVE